MTAPKLALPDTLPLLNSVKIPHLGFGVYLSPEKQCVISCLAALKTGYRHIDTAQYYGNEKEVGEAVRRSGLKRSELFITTKILEPKGSIEESYQSVLNSVYIIDGKDAAVDLFLIHAASADSKSRKELWLALERLHKAGKAKSIGVSNYGIKHIEEMKEYATIWPPHVNQLEKGWVPLPKSDAPSRIAANAEVYGFELSEEEMSELDKLDQGERGSICYAVKNV
ncbi:MAG: hypothetical protein M1818_002760 [Claussenomyces sp. TS43310]|nr:MAG: hypothetical protein M1818_002760 [Claussenomyces sp. TS43310]